MRKKLLTAVCAILFLGVAFPAAADLVFTVGIHPNWSIDQVKWFFHEQGAEPKGEGAGEESFKRDFDEVIGGTVAALEKMVPIEGKKSPWASALTDVDLQELDFPKIRDNLTCHYWERRPRLGSELREDIAFMGVALRATATIVISALPNAAHLRARKSAS